MAFQSVPNCAEAAVIFQLNTIFVQNALKFTFVGGGYDQSDIDALAESVDVWVAAEILPLLSNQCAYARTDVRGLESLNDYEAVDATSAGVGAQGVAPLPNSCAFAIKFGTGLTGRSARGRAFITGIPINQQQTNENFVLQTWADSLVAGFEELPGAVIGAGWAHVVVSRFTGGAERTPTGVFFPVTSYSWTDLRIDSQRERMP